VSGLVLSRDVEDSIGIDLEGALDLGDTTGGGGNTSELELAEEVVVTAHDTLTLVNGELDGGLAISNGGEGLLLDGGNGGVAGDDDGHDSTLHLDSEAEGHNVEEEEVLGLGALLAGDDGGLNGGTVGDGLIRVDGPVELLALEEVLEEGLDLGNTGGAANEDDIVNLLLLALGVLEHLVDGVEAADEEVVAELLKLGTGEGEGNVNTIMEGVNLNGGLELSLEELNDAVVKVLTSEVSVSGGGLDGEDARVNGQEGNIEGASTEIKDEHGALLLVLATLLGVVKTVGNGGGGGLVDDAEHVKARDGTGVLGGIALGVVEVSGHGDDGLLDGLSEVGLSDFLHLDEHHGGDLLRGKGLLLVVVLNLNDGLGVNVNDLEGPMLHVSLDLLVGEAASNQTLGVKDGVGGVHRGLVLGGISNQTLSPVEGDVGRSGAVSLVIGDDLNTVTLPDSNTGVSGSNSSKKKEREKKRKREVQSFVNKG
jgi:hypothetical protein